MYYFQSFDANKGFLLKRGKISGTIMDGEFNEPMAFANVLIKNTTKGTIMILMENITVDIEPGLYTVVFSYIGYQTIEISDDEVVKR